MATADSAGVKALVFDVFGTCVDWRSGIAREFESFARAHGIKGVDGATFADAWRAHYQPQMEEVRSGRRSWTILDVLHRESLDRVIADFGLEGVPAATRDEWNLVWHRLDPWPDVIEGLARLKRKFIIAPLSNGNVALLLDMAKRSGLPWDAILGAEVARAYKPLPEAYIRTAEILGLAPAEVMLVAAHNNDLIAAALVGLKCAFVARPREHGPGQTKDLTPERPFDLIAGDFLDLAGKMGC